MKRKYYGVKTRKIHIDNQGKSDSVVYVGSRTKEVQAFVGGGRQFKTSKRENLYFLGTAPVKEELQSIPTKQQVTKKGYTTKTVKKNGNRRITKNNRR